ncbi:MAG TPA: hypothetical protein PLJ29_05525 [Leptospiraceae bacterium]|nr:hypothetical protein [Leptospiraceae bacterium]HNF24014.1 hypothetical protein [Leptospiraceae bacterium]HNI25798.1 hypothetical protein [Leptospiraceae bacterium]
MKTLLISILLFAAPLFSEEKRIFKKMDSVPIESSCRSDHFTVCLAYKFLKHFYPELKNPEWYRNTVPSHYFEYKVVYNNSAENGEIIFSFESFSDGLEWGYWDDSVISRTTSPIQIIESEKTRQMIQKALEKKFGKDLQIEKITKIIERRCMQSQTNPKDYYDIKENIRFKVQIKGESVLFKQNGEMR